MKNIKLLQEDVLPVHPQPNSLVVSKDKLVYYNENTVATVLNETAEGDSGGTPMTSITHADLLALVNNSELVAGQQYRITDYVATVDQDIYNPDNGTFYARSNNHAFDIIVTADSTNKLNENARAIRHEGDTYFPAHTNFESWKIKYTIYNNIERFVWALSTGKGVIYQLIDEWNNNIAYDFKSIQFQRNDVWVYTFGGETDASLELENCYNNTILNNRWYLSNNTFGSNCSSNTFQVNCESNTFGDDCSSNIFGEYCSSNIFGNSCNSNTFESGCNSNTFGDECYLNTFGNECSLNTFGDGCFSNTFGNSCYSNTFGNMFRFNTFGNACNSNTFGNNCHNNTFANIFYSNTFGESCDSNTFGHNCNSNTFGIQCFSNMFGNSCNSNKFGDTCHSNTFGSTCLSNTFGNTCYSNTFGNFCSYLIIENNPSCRFSVSNEVTDINLSEQTLNFTTPPDSNDVNVVRTPTGYIMSQVIDATTTESFDI